MNKYLVICIIVIKKWCSGKYWFSMFTLKSSPKILFPQILEICKKIINEIGFLGKNRCAGAFHFHKNHCHRYYHDDDGDYRLEHFHSPESAFSALSCGKRIWAFPSRFPFAGLSSAFLSHSLSLSLYLFISLYLSLSFTHTNTHLMWKEKG